MINELKKIRIWDKNEKYASGFIKKYEYWTIEISFRQHTLGSFIIFCNRNIEKISDLNELEIQELPKIMKISENALINNPIFNPDRFNYLQLGNNLHHLHIHGIPRYKNERTFMNKIWKDTTWGKPPKWADKDIDENTIIEINNSLKKFFF